RGGGSTAPEGSGQGAVVRRTSETRRWVRLVGARVAFPARFGSRLQRATLSRRWDESRNRGVRQEARRARDVPSNDSVNGIPLERREKGQASCALGFWEARSSLVFGGRHTAARPLRTRQIPTTDTSRQAARAGTPATVGTRAVAVEAVAALGTTGSLAVMEAARTDQVGRGPRAQRRAGLAARPGAAGSPRGAGVARAWATQAPPASRRAAPVEATERMGGPTVH